MRCFDICGKDLIWSKQYLGSLYDCGDFRGYLIWFAVPTVQVCLLVSCIISWSLLSLFQVRSFGGERRQTGMFEEMVRALVVQSSF